MALLGLKKKPVEFDKQEMGEIHWKFDILTLLIYVILYTDKLNFRTIKQMLHGSCNL